MGFGNHGFFVTDPDEQWEQKEIRRILALYLNEWIEKLNYKKYKQTLDTELEQFSQIEITLLESGDKKDIFNVKLIKRNEYILHELKCLEGKINSIKNLITSGGWDVTKMDHSIRFYEMNDLNINSGANISFLKEHRESYLYRFNSDWDVITRISSIDKECALYYFSLIYVDFCKTQKFLLKLYDHIIPIKIKEDESDFTATQWMLIHYTLQECGIRRRFFEKVKELKVLSKEYNLSAKNLEMKYNIISNSQGQEGYTQKDALKVYFHLKANFPLALPKFEEITK